MAALASSKAAAAGNDIYCKDKGATFVRFQKKTSGVLRAWASRPSFTAMLFESGEGCLSVATTPAEAEAAAAHLRLCVRRQRLLKKI